MNIEDLGNRCHEMENRIEKHKFELICRLCNLNTERSGVDRLYKFISFNSDKELNKIKIDTFGKGDLYASFAKDFNDPYDCQLSLHIDSYMDFEQILMNGLAHNRKEKRAVKNKKGKRKKIEDLQKEFGDKWIELRNEIAVCCFTEQVDNFLMWSHYANCYNGICLEYDKEEIGDYPLAAVHYTTQLENMIKSMTSEDLRANNYSKLLMNAITALFSKHQQWAYEQEWRIVVLVNSDKDRYIHMPTPKKLYIGFKLEQNIRKDIIHKAKQLGIPEIVKTKISSKEYKLIHKPIK